MKTLHIKDGTVKAISLPGEPIGILYGDLVTVTDDFEIGVGDKAPEAPAEAAEPEAKAPAKTRSAA